MRAALRVWFKTTVPLGNIVGDPPVDLAVAAQDARAIVDDLAEQIEAITPRTMAGVQANARAALALWTDGDGTIEDNDSITLLARSLVRDLGADAT